MSLNPSDTFSEHHLESTTRRPLLFFSLFVVHSGLVYLWWFCHLPVIIALLVTHPFQCVSEYIHSKMAACFSSGEESGFFSYFVFLLPLLSPVGRLNQGFLVFLCKLKVIFVQWA